MSKDIATWLENGSNYNEGISLYENIGTDEFLIRFFKKGESAFTKQKLAEALGDLLLSAEPEASVPDQPDLQEHEELNEPIIPKSKNLTVSRSQVNGKKLDAIFVDEAINLNKTAALPELLKVTNQIAANYAEIRGLHPYLSITDEGESLRQVALRIQKLGVRNSELMSLKNYIIENGSDEPEVEEIKPPVMIDYNLIRERESIRKSLNKAENRLKKQNPKKDYTLALIIQRKKDLADIDDQIARAKVKGGSNVEK